MKVLESKNIYDVLELIRRRSELFLTSKTITSLQDFINGYLIVNPYNNNRKGEPEFELFLISIISKKKSGTKRDAFTDLLKQCNGNEENAFIKFYEYLDEFLEKNSS